MSRAKKIVSHEFREDAVVVVDQRRPLALANGLVAGLRAEWRRFDGRLSARPTGAGSLDGLPANDYVGIGEAPCRNIALGSVPERAADLVGSCTVATGVSSETVVSIRVPISNPAST